MGAVRHTSIDVLHLVLPSVLHKKSQDRITAQCWKQFLVAYNPSFWRKFLTPQMCHDVYGTPWC